MAFKAKVNYKGRPLVRSKNEIYYGNMSDPYVINMQVLSTKEENGEELPDKISIALLSTDVSLDLPDRLVRQSMKNGLFNALDFATVMLERALADEKK